MLWGWSFHKQRSIAQHERTFPPTIKGQRSQGRVSNTRTTSSTRHRSGALLSCQFLVKRFLLQILQGDTEEGIPTCAYWSESNNTWLNDAIVLESYNVDPDGGGTIACSTYHLSAFAIAGAESVSGEWGFSNLLGGADVLREVGFMGHIVRSISVVR